MREFSIILVLKKKFDVLKSKSSCFLLNKNLNFNKNETELKMENPTHTLERRTLRFSSYENRKLKVKLWWVRAHKQSAFFVTFILSEGKVFNVCVLSQYIVYIEYIFQNTCTFTCQKTLLHTLLLLLFEIVKNLQCIRKQRNWLRWKRMRNKRLQT